MNPALRTLTSGDVLLIGMRSCKLCRQMQLSENHTGSTAAARRSGVAQRSGRGGRPHRWARGLGRPSPKNTTLGCGSAQQPLSAHAQQMRLTRLNVLSRAPSAGSGSHILPRTRVAKPSTRLGLASRAHLQHAAALRAGRHHEALDAGAELYVAVRPPRQPIRQLQPPVWEFDIAVWPLQLAGALYSIGACGQARVWTSEPVRCAICKWTHVCNSSCPSGSSTHDPAATVCWSPARMLKRMHLLAESGVRAH